MSDVLRHRPLVRRTTFGPITLRSDECVLEPRAWTLLQSEWAAELAPSCAPGPILELCAGAGQIGLAAAKLSGRALVQVDDDAHACDWARRNAAANDINSEVWNTDLGRTQQVLGDRRFALVIADPPYLTSASVDSFPADPVHAIDGGPDGLAVVRLALAAAHRHAVHSAPVLLQLRGAAQVGQLAAALDHATAPFQIEVCRAHDPERAVVLLRAAT